MQTRNSRFGFRHFFYTTICALLLCSAAASAKAENAIDQGYRQMYNRDFAGAHTTFNGWITAHPEDPLGPASDAAAFLFTELERLDVVSTQLFNDPAPRTGGKPGPTSPQLRADFDRRTQQAEKLADAILAKSSKDANALFAKMLIYGLRADFAVMIDKNDLKALGFSKKGAMYSDQTLAADPQFYDAHIATGFENYMLSTKPLAVRFVARLLGGQTDKAKGISELQITAQHGRYLAPFAEILLSVAMLRDGNRTEAKRILASLNQRFPQNTLYRRQLARLQ